MLDSGASSTTELVRGLRTRLARTIAHFMGPSETRLIPTPGLLLAQRKAPTAPCSGTYEPSLIVVAQGRKRVDLGQTTFFYDESRFLLTSIDLPTVSQVVEASEDRPCLAMGLKLEMSVVREVLMQEEIHVSEMACDIPAMATGQVTPELLSPCCRLIDLLATPQHLPFFLRLIQREIIYRLLCGPEGGRLRAIATIGDQSNRTAKVIAWVRDHYAQPVRVEELAEMAGMGVSTLHHHFRVLTKLSPLQYQKQLRLQMARGRMAVDGIDATTAAFEVGYESVSQFNREYSRFFGQPPMRDVRTLRVSDATPIDSIRNLRRAHSAASNR